MVGLEKHEWTQERLSWVGCGIGYMTAMAALRHGDFFKVAVTGGGNYDQGLFWHNWGERYHGRFADDHYATQAARTYAEGLTGKLMLVHGLMDTDYQACLRYPCRPCEQGCLRSCPQFRKWPEFRKDISEELAPAPAGA